MSAAGLGQAALALGLVLALAVPLARSLARVYDGGPCALRRVLGPLERLLLRLGGVRPEAETGWRAYARALLAFHLLGTLLVYAVQRCQHLLPGNPAGLGPVAPDVAWNTAISFVTNTNWQAYGGETTMSQATQAVALTTQNFVSAATGLAVAVVLARGFARREARTVGCFGADLVRSVVYVLLPLSVVLALALVLEGVPQTTAPALTATLVEPSVGPDGAPRPTQTVALGPVASQVAIKQLGTNGGGYYNVNSAHPLENPTPTSNLLQTVAILLLAAALPLAFGRWVGRPRDGRALLLAMVVLLVPAVLGAIAAEASPSPALRRPEVDASAGNLEGKEVRFGVAGSATWAAFTTAASNGSVNSMHDAYTPLGGLVPMVLMQLGEVVFGGVGSGLYGLVVFALVAVFVAGLMIGRTPEYLGKKVEAAEMKLASLTLLAPSLVVLLGTAVAVARPATRAALGNPGAHGFSEVLYAFSSAGNNNGSAFAGLTVATPFFDVALGLAMFVGRFVPLLATLGIAGSLARKKSVPSGPGTLPTDGPLFVGLLVATVVLLGALTFVPALALGPVVEHLEAVR